MYQTLLIVHGFIRWVVLAFLVTAILKSFKGYITGSTFSKTDNAIRHWTATMAHLQLMIGIVVYTQSPFVKAYFAAPEQYAFRSDPLFFGIFHFSMMLIAIILLTVGSAIAKRKPLGREKFRCMLLWFSVALLLILLAIPWPFSPLAGRPLLRTF